MKYILLKMKQINKITRSFMKNCFRYMKYHEFSSTTMYYIIY